MDTSLIRARFLAVPRVSTIERFQCILTKKNLYCSPEQKVCRPFTISTRIVSTFPLLRCTDHYVHIAHHTPTALTPSHGTILGGDTISVTGPCFDLNSQIQCEFDNDVSRSAIFVSNQEVLCVSPQLRHSGQLSFRLLVDRVAVGGRQRFTSSK